MERDRPRDDVRMESSPTRCPYCHEGVAVEAEAWVACERCLARHHRACWDEGQRCAACSATVPLARDRPVDPVQALERSLAAAGFPMRLVASAEPGLGETSRRSWVVEGSRVLPFEVDPARRGVFRSDEPFVRAGAKRNRQPPVAIEVASGEGRTTIRIRIDLRDVALGLYGGLVGGLGGGGGGGCAYPAWLLGGNIGVVLCAVGFVVLGFVLARLILGFAAASQRGKVERALDALERSLAPAARAAPAAPEKRRPSPKDEGSL